MYVRVLAGSCSGCVQFRGKTKSGTHTVNVLVLSVVLMKSCMIQVAAVAKHNAEAQGNVHALFIYLFLCNHA